MAKKRIINYIIIPIITICTSLILGMVFNDITLGATTLIFGFLNAYYMAIGKPINYVFGIFFSITYAWECYNNGLFGFLIFTIIVYTPIQVFGLINWIKHKTSDSEVLMKSLNVKNGIMLTILLLGASFGLGALLSLIPGQNLAYWDSSSQISNLCGVILATIRFREAWYIWLVNNVIDLLIWIIRVLQDAVNAQMALMVSIMYLIMNIIGIIMWIKIENKQKEQKIWLLQNKGQF